MTTTTTTPIPRQQRRGFGYYFGSITQSTPFRIMLVWALVFGTWNRSGYSALHFAASLWQDFMNSPALLNFSPEKVNVVAFAFAIGAVGISFTAGNIMCRMTGRNRFKHMLFNLAFGLIIGMIIFLVLSGADGTQYNFAPLLWTLFLGGSLLFVWWLFYKWATELMGKSLFWFATLVIAVGMSAAIYTMQWSVDVITIIQVVIALALSVGSVIYPMIRRRATGTGSTFTSYHGGDDSGNDTAGDVHGHH